MSGEMPDPGEEYTHEDQVLNPEAVLQEQAEKDARAMREADAFRLREGLDEQYKALMASDPFWRQFDGRLAASDSQTLINKAIKAFIEKSDGRYSEEQIREFARMHQEHYRQ